MKRNYRVLLATAMLALSVLSCKKQDQPEKPSQSEQLTAATAKLFFESKVKKIGVRSERVIWPIGEPVWDSAYDKRLNIGDAIAAPLKMKSYHKIAGVEVQGDNYLLIYKKQDGSLKHEVVTVIPASSHESVASFNGIVIIRDWSGDILKGFNYINGKAVSTTIKMGSERSATTEKQEPCAEAETTVCFPWANGMGYYCDYHVPVVASCPGGGGVGGGPDFPGGGGSWGGEPGGGNPDPGNYPNPVGGGNGNGGNKGGTYKMENNTTSPCIRQVVDKINNPNLQNSISKMVYDLFGSETGEYTVLFTESVRADTNNQAITITLNSNTFEINFNAGRLAKSSEEQIASTALHEMLHAYWDCKRRNSNDPLMLAWEEKFQHITMAASYIGRLANGVQELYPNTNRTDAESLAWIGLHKTDIWKSMEKSQPDSVNAILSRAFEFDDKHTKGTRCK